MRGPDNCGGVIVLSDWGVRLYGPSGVLGSAAGTWKHTSASCSLRRVHKSTTTPLTDVLLADATGGLHVICVASSSTAAQIACSAASTVRHNSSPYDGAPASCVRETVPSAAGSSSTMRTALVARVDGTVQLVQLRRTPVVAFAHGYQSLCAEYAHSAMHTPVFRHKRPWSHSTIASV